MQKPTGIKFMNEPSVLLHLKGVSKTYGKVQAVYPLDLKIRKGEFLAILGPSGCGKSTILSMIGGFTLPTDGSIFIGGKNVTKLGPEHRPTNLVFQGYGLFPHMTVAENIAYGLHIAKIKKSDIDERVREVMGLVRLKQYSDRMVTQLSGGEQQRVALARALIMKPEALLLDEPLAALDLKLRKAMQEELRHIHQTTGGTFVFVTHDQEEAMGLATRICVMEGGRIVQNGSPEEIYSSPKTPFVSTFIGEANIMAGQRENDYVTLDVGIKFKNIGPNESITAVVRPEKMLIGLLPEDEVISSCDAYLSGRLLDAIFHGPFINFSVEITEDTIINVHSRNVEIRNNISKGKSVFVGWHFVDQRVLPDS